VNKSAIDMTTGTTTRPTTRTYVPAKPCYRGHPRLRYVASNACVECMRLHNARQTLMRREDRA
jgi:hypothetical protein